MQRKKKRTNRQEDKKAVFGYTSVAPAYKNQKNETHIDRYKKKQHTHTRKHTLASESKTEKRVEERDEL